MRDFAAHVVEDIASDTAKAIFASRDLIREAKGFAMLRKMGFIMLFVLVGTMHADAQDRSSPAATVRSMMAAFGRGDFKKAAACVKGANPDPSQLSDMPSLIKDGAARLILSHTKTTIHDSSAVLTGTVTMQLHDDPKPLSSFVKTRFTKLGGNWLIIADTSRALNGKTSDFVNAVAVDMVNPAIYRHQRAQVDAVVCLNHIDLICVGTLRQTLHNDGVFNLKPDDYQQNILSYTYSKKKELFTCPSDTEDLTSYSFNGNLTGLSLAKIELSNKVVMIYEGKDGKLNFRHDGKAAVGFTDGQTVLVTPAEAASLHWKP